MHIMDRGRIVNMATKIMDSVIHTLQSEADTIRQLAKDINPAQIEDVTNVIIDCKGKIITSGCGTSGAAARKIAHTLNCVECPALFLSPADAVHGGLGVVQKGDVVILLSKGGATPEINQMILACEKKDAIIIGVTEKEDSYLAKKSKYILKIKIDKEPDDFNMLATASTMAVTAVFDAIAIAVTRIRGYSKKEFLLIHPGGDVGNRLLEEEND